MTYSWFTSFVKIFVDCLMIFCPPLCYVIQARKFQRTQSSKGFSKFLTLMLLLTNILKIYFWFGKPFALALLFQSILITIAHLYLLHIFFKYQDISEKNKYIQKTFLEHCINWKDVLNPLKIWNYDYEIDYYKFILFLNLLLASLCFIIGFDQLYFFEIIGSISVLIEIFTGIPQIKETCTTKNSNNISIEMISMWIIGDSFKLGYNIVYKSPFQIIGGSVFQLLGDIFLLTQVIRYNENCVSFSFFKKKYESLTTEENEEKNSKISLGNSVDKDIELLDTECNSEIQLDNLLNKDVEKKNEPSLSDKNENS